MEKGRGKQKTVLKKIIKELFPILIPVITRAMEENKANLGITQCCMILYANLTMYTKNNTYIPGRGKALKKRITQAYSNLHKQFTKDIPNNHEKWRVTRIEC